MEGIQSAVSFTEYSIGFKLIEKNLINFEPKAKNFIKFSFQKNLLLMMKKFKILNKYISIKCVSLYVKPKEKRNK
jgi:hypothetical protein